MDGRQDHHRSQDKGQVGQEEVFGHHKVDRYGHGSYFGPVHRGDGHCPGIDTGGQSGRVNANPEDVLSACKRSQGLAGRRLPGEGQTRRDNRQRKSGRRLALAG